MADENDIQNSNKLNNLLAKQVEFEKTRARLSGESLSNLEKEQIILARRDQIAREFRIILEEDADSRQRTLEYLEKEIETEQRRGKITASLAAERIKSLRELNAAIASGDDKQLERQKKKLELLEKENKAREKTLSSMQSAERAGEALVDTMGNLLGISKNTGDSFRDIGNAIKGGSKSLKEFGSSAAKTLGDRFGLASVLGMVVNNQFQVTVGFNQLKAQMLGATGANRELGQTVEDSSRAFKTQGVLFADAGRAATALYRDFSKFSTLNKDSQVDTIGTTAMLANLGVSAETTAKNYNFLTSEIGMSVPKATAAIREMTEEGASMGLAPAEMNSAFAALAPRLSEFGARAPKIFSNTAMMAKKLGINVEDMGGTLFSLSDKLSDFGGSASVAADLAVALGGSYVSAFDLTMAAEEGPPAQLELLRKTFKLANKDFNKMGFWRQRFVAKGFSLDVGKVRAILGKGADATEIFTGEQKKLEEMSTNATDSLKDQQAVFENLTKAINKSADAMKEISEGAVKATSSKDGGDGGGFMLGLVGLGVAMDAVSMVRGGMAARAATKAALGTKLNKPVSTGPRINTNVRSHKAPSQVNTQRRHPLNTPKAPISTKVIPKVPISAALGAGKMAARMVPFLSLGIGAAEAAYFASQGEYLNAGLAGLSGLAATFLAPVGGTAVAMGLQGAIIANQMGAFDSKDSANAQDMTQTSSASTNAAGITPLLIEQAMIRALRAVKIDEKETKVIVKLDNKVLVEAVMRGIERKNAT